MDGADSKSEQEPGETAARVFAGAAEDMDAARTFLQRQAQERPFVVIGVALAVGLLLGALTTRGRK